MSGFVEHGRTIWQLALVALVSLGALAALLLPAVGRRLRARWVRRALGDARSTRGLADGMVVTLAGALSGRGVHLGLTGEAARTVVTSGATTHLRTDDVRLSVEGTEIELVGPLEVALGAEESSVHVGGAGAGTRVRTRVVRPGDRVRVRGALQTCAGDAPEAGYRVASHRFQLVPERPGARLRLVAERAPGRLGRPLGAVVRGALGGVAAFVLLFVVGGAAAAAVARQVPAGAPDAALRPGWGLSATAWAAATPFHREAAFAALGRALRERPRPSLIDATAALARRSPADCTAATRALRQAGALADAAARGERCSAPAARLEAARARVGLADYAEADRLYRALDRELGPDALGPADRERALAAQVLGPAPSPWTVRDEDRCLLVSAAVATVDLGPDFARDQLRRALRDGGPSRRACALLLAPHLSGRDRHEVLAGTVAADHPLALLLRIAEDPAQPQPLPGETPSAWLRRDAELLVGLAAAPHAALVPALERELLARPLSSEPSPAALRRRVWLAGDVATVAALAGDGPAAAAALDVARQAVGRARSSRAGPLDRSTELALSLLVAAIGVTLPDLARPDEGARASLRGDPLGQLLLLLGEVADGGGVEPLLARVAAGSDAGAWRRAASGDGRALAAALARRRAPGPLVPAVVLALSPRLRQGRAELAGWAKSRAGGGASLPPAAPLPSLVTISRRLALARALGDTRRAAELDGARGRAYAALRPPGLALAAVLIPAGLR